MATARTRQARIIVFDADDGPQFERAVHLSIDLGKEGVPSYLEESRRGGHLWLFFSSSMSGKDARLFARQVAERRHLNGDKGKMSIVSAESAQQSASANGKVKVVQLKDTSRDIQRTRLDGYLPALKNFL